VSENLAILTSPYIYYLASDSFL